MNINSIKVKDLLIFLSILILSFSIFNTTDKFQFFSVRFYIVPIILLALAFYSTNFNKNSLNLSLLWFITAIIFTVSTILSSNQEISIMYTIYYIEFVLLFILLQFNHRWTYYTNKLFYLIAIILMGFTFISIIAPNIYFTIFSYFFNSEKVLLIKKLMNSGSYAGFTKQLGYNGFFLSLGLAYLIPKIIYRSNSRSYFMIFLLIIAVILTGKRGIILANAVAIIALVTINIRMKDLWLIISKKWIKISFVIIILIAGGVLYSQSSANKKFDNEDLTSGRLTLYMKAVDIIKENPIIGIGISTYSTEIISASYNENIDAHNIYLQLFAETGLIGFIPFVTAMAVGLLTTIRKILTGSRIQSNYCESRILQSSLYVQILFIIYGLTGNPLYNMNLLLLYFVYLSMSSIQFKSDR